MNINDFKTFTNSTFKMGFIINNNENDDNIKETNNNEKGKYGMNIFSTLNFLPFLRTLV